MNAILEVPEEEIKIEFDNLNYNQFRMIGRRLDIETSMFIEKYPVGEPITLITSNMPKILLEQVKNLIEKYCDGR